MFIQSLIYMKKLLILSLCFCIACGASQQEDAKQSLIENINSALIADIFKQNGVEGCFILYDLHKDQWLIYNEERSKKVFSPASTFKIPNSLIALETKAVAHRYQIIPWDGEKRSVKAWNQNHDLGSAFKVSAVWFYQEVARRVGKKRMQAWVDTMQYGNQDISGGIDQFWLQGALRISPKEQIEFLKKFYHEEFPFAPENYQAVKDIMNAQKTDTYTISAKTGWGIQANENKDVGWYVGYVETMDDVLFFVNNIDILKNEDAKARINIVHEVLKELEIMSLLD